MQLKKPRYIRKETYAVGAVLGKITCNKRDRVDFDGDLMKMSSQRYYLFLHKGCTCVRCKLEGTFFAKEQTAGEKSYHFNLYGIRDGEEILFTKDHIIPKSKGGPDKYTNYDTMCETCNSEKGNENNG